MTTTPTPRHTAIKDWAYRHDFGGNFYAAKAAFEDAESMYQSAELAAERERSKSYKEVAEWMSHHFIDDCGELDHNAAQL